MLIFVCQRLIFDCRFFHNLVCRGAGISAAGITSGSSPCQRLRGCSGGGRSFSWHRGFCLANTRWGPMLEKRFSAGVNMWVLIPSDGLGRRSRAKVRYGSTEAGPKGARVSLMYSPTSLFTAFMPPIYRALYATMTLYNFAP